MDIITLFKQAALALQKDERYLQLAQARQANDDDEELQNTIGEFNLVRLDLNNEMEKTDRDEERVKELDAKINDLYNSIMMSASMLAYNDAKQNIKGLVSYINSIVAAAVDGDDPMLVTEPVEGCGSDGCASCSGCG